MRAYAKSLVKTDDFDNSKEPEVSAELETGKFVITNRISAFCL